VRKVKKAGENRAAEVDPPVLEHIELDFDLRAAFPDYINYFDIWRRKSELAREKLSPLLDVAYGPGDRNRLDFFAAQSANRPLLVFIHGGYWRSMDKADFSFIAPAFVANDFNVAIINYPLTPSVRIEEIVRHVRLGCRWLYENAAALRVDPLGLHLVGWSAGAHLAMMMTARGQSVAAQSSSSFPVKSVFAVSGIYDLFPVRHTSANAGFRLTHEEAQLNSPLYLHPNSDSKLAVVWGALETPTFRAQSLALANAWQASFRLEVENCHHYAAMGELARPASPVLSMAIDLINSCQVGKHLAS
jgi:arylformamidase